jgi:hypothetical protein
MADRDAIARSIQPERPTTVERAFQLARSGQCNNVAEIAATLKRERHEAVDAHLAGPSIRQSLRLSCQNAKQAREVVQPDERDRQQSRGDEADPTQPKITAPQDTTIPPLSLIAHSQAFEAN